MSTIVFGMEINCRRLDRGVPQIFLNKANVVAGIRLVGCRGMPQPMSRGSAKGNRLTRIGRFQLISSTPKDFFHDQVNCRRGQETIRSASDTHNERCFFLRYRYRR